MLFDVDLEKWKSALLSTLFISSVPNLLLFLIPNSWLKKKNKQTINVQNILLTFAAGGLLGDVILHIIPHLLVPHDHHTHSDEASHAALRHDHDHEHDHHAHSGQHNEADDKHHHDHDRVLWIGLFILTGFLLFFLGEKMLSVHMMKSNRHSNSSSWLPESLSTMGWLNISADLMHNFTDGVAMGASCAASASGSGSSGRLMAAATLSIFFHEVPHEIGDFAVLVQSGIRCEERHHI